jgi:hypothetical protein
VLDSEEASELIRLELEKATYAVLVRLLPEIMDKYLDNWRLHYNLDFNFNCSWTATGAK